MEQHETNTGTVTVVRDAEDRCVWVFDTPEETDAVAWFREHMVWAFKSSTVAQAARAQLRLAGVPDRAIELVFTDTVLDLVEKGFTE